jgi:SAM-dependent methyltransferase
MATLLAMEGKCQVTMLDPRTLAGTQRSYDRLAEEYAARIFGEMAGKPLDRALLDCLAEQVGPLGPVADIGCGPGHVARYLHERGVPTLGIDLSPEMVARARRLSPDIPFEQGNMLALAAEDASWGGIVAYYSIIHIPPDAVPKALAEFHRVLRPGGRMMLGFHAGEDELVHQDEQWGFPIALDYYFYRPETLARYTQAAGFTLEAQIVRAPYAPDVEHQSQRGYLLARKG